MVVQESLKLLALDRNQHRLPEVGSHPNDVRDYRLTLQRITMLAENYLVNCRCLTVDGLVN